jgi:hypothetical protein
VALPLLHHGAPVPSASAPSSPAPHRWRASRSGRHRPLSHLCHRPLPTFGAALSPTFGRGLSAGAQGRRA